MSQDVIIIYRTNGNEVVGKQGRRVSASGATVPRVGAHVWRPRRAGYPVPHGSGMAAVSRFDCTSAEATHRPTATATPAYGRGQVSREARSDANTCALAAFWQDRRVARTAASDPHRRGGTKTSLGVFVALHMS